MYSDNKEKGPEVYLVKYGLSNSKTSSRSWVTNRMMELKESLDLSCFGYPTFVKTKGAHSNRRFILIPDQELLGITVELIHPHHAMMPETFLDDILENFPINSQPLHISNDISRTCDNLIVFGWNPNLATHTEMVSMVLKSTESGRQDRYIILPKFLMGLWEKRRDEILMQGIEVNIKNYIEWACEMQEENPHLSLKYWQNQKETKIEWESIN